MTDAVKDLVGRMLAGDADAGAVADLCGRAVEGLAHGDVCCRVEDAAARALLRSKPALVSAAPDDARPFVLSGDLLYTRRNWRYERTVAEGVAALCAAARTPCDATARNGADFATLTDEQRAAVRDLATARFSLLTGGPGTGKTFTLSRAVALVQQTNPGLRLALAAPTGKAAARMTEALAGTAAAGTAVTLHRLLGVARDGVTFARGKGDPLAADWVVVDEASMIDLPLMAHLLDALPDGCRLTLVGDEHQLASVAPGRVFGDLCRFPGVTPSRLSVSKRFRAGGAVARLADAVNGGDAAAALACLSAPSGEVSYTRVEGGDPAAWGGFRAFVRAKFAAFVDATDPADALAHVNDVRVLCAVRGGAYGTEALNVWLLQTLVGSARAPRGPVPLMVTRNDRTLGVANGDVGVVMPDDPRTLHLPAEHGVRTVRTELLGGTEPAFATTVHKSQGSEFGDVAVVLPPDGDTPSLSREMLYTAITRTKRAVALYAGDAAVAACCHTPVRRVTGLAR